MVEMSNPLFGLLGAKSNPFMDRVRNAGQAIRAMKDPQAYAQQMIQQNPQLQEVLRKYNGDPRAAFNAVAKQMGVDPNEVMRSLGM